jgi:hypothetical protein
MTTTARPATVLLRPSRPAPWAAVIPGLVAAVLPPYATAFLLAAPRGRFLAISIAAAITLLLVLAVGWRLARTRVLMDDRGIVEHWLLGTRRTAAEQVASALVITLYDSQSLLPRRQLFLLDAQQRTLLRLGGRWWNDAAMTAVLRHFDIPVETAPDPVTLRELRRSRGAQLRWYERHPVLCTVCLVPIGVLVCAGIAVAVTLSIR